MKLSTQYCKRDSTRRCWRYVGSARLKFAAKFSDKVAILKMDRL